MTEEQLLGMVEENARMRAALKIIRHSLSCDGDRFIKRSSINHALIAAGYEPIPEKEKAPTTAE